ncbi:MAG TPA: chloride channel protein [Thermoleophilaceae bacterium]|nr:chloride channel protein [Thermoleophilaceae bacterium]
MSSKGAGAGSNGHLTVTRLARLDTAGWTLVALALAVGAGAGAGAVAFRYMIKGFTWLFTGHAQLGARPHPASPWLPGIGIACVVIAPVIGGLIYGPLVARFAPEARGHGVPEVMLAVARKGGRIRPQVSIVKSLASALCIGSGGSVGREGPIVQIGSALGSTLGQLARVNERRLRLLVACGAAGGIAATFNAPIAGVFFALEVILRDFQTESFAVVVLSSVTAAVIGRVAFGSHAFLHLPQFQVHSGGEYLLYALLGVLGAAVGVAFIRVLYGSEDLADRIWRGPEWLRPGVGGILLGLLLLALPQMYGVGYPVLDSAVAGHFVIGFLLILLVGKVVATSLTIAIGGSGGVFAPSLFMGAMLGSCFGQTFHSLIPGWVTSPGAYGLVGMAAVFAAAARAPITAVIIVFELTGDYSIILPLMLAVVVAAGLATLITPDTIYTLKLRRRGIDVNAARPAGPMQQVRVREAMRPVPGSVPPELPLAELAARLSAEHERALPVVAEDGSLVGVVSVDDLEPALTDVGGPDSARDLARPVPNLRSDASLENAARLLGESEEDGIPVLAPEGSGVVGWITHQDVLRAYLRGTQPSAPPVPITSAAGPGLKS